MRGLMGVPVLVVTTKSLPAHSTTRGVGIESRMNAVFESPHVRRTWSPDFFTLDKSSDTSWLMMAHVFTSSVFALVINVPPHVNSGRKIGRNPNVMIILYYVHCMSFLCIEARLAPRRPGHKSRQTHCLFYQVYRYKHLHFPKNMRKRVK